MKTGFICASGYNLVASATRNGKRLIAVVLGAPSAGARGARGADCWSAVSAETGSAGCSPRSAPSTIWCRSTRAAESARRHVRRKRKRPATDEDADVVAANGGASTGETPVTFFTAGLQPPVGSRPT